MVLIHQNHLYIHIELIKDYNKISLLEVKHIEKQINKHKIIYNITTIIKINSKLKKVKIIKDCLTLVLILKHQFNKNQK